MSSISIRIDENGDMLFVYSDEMLDLMNEGEAQIERASHVEPCGTEWTADMAPVGGPVLGPFKTRQEGLQAEQDWIFENLINV